MNRRVARLLDDLYGGANSRSLYMLVRDGETSELAAILTALERRNDSAEARDALLRFTWLLLDARPERGSEETRKRDRAAQKLKAEAVGRQRNALAETPMAKR